MRRLQQAKGAHDVRLDEAFRIVDRAIDMALGSEIDNGPWLMLDQQARDELLVGNVSFDKNMLIGVDGCKILEISRVCQPVKIDDGFSRPNKISHEIRADESRAASDKKHLHPHFDLSVYLLLLTKSIEAQGAEISNSLKYRRHKQPKIAEQSLAIDAGSPKIV